jgi:hypothetical protein
MPTSVRTQAIAVTQATTIVMPATSNSKDDSNIMTTKSRNASNSRNITTTGQPTQYGRQQKQGCLQAKVGILEKLVKPATACREASFSRDIVKIRETAAAGTIGTSWMSSVV